MKSIELTAITNFLLAAEIFYLAGRYFELQKQTLSSAWWWNISIILLGVTALVGGIDHGFFEINGRPERIYLTKFNWGVLGVLSFSILMSVSKQFFSPKVQIFLLGIGLFQFLIYILLLRNTNSFLLVILNNVPAMMLLLFMNIIKISSFQGSWSMIFGVSILIVASLVQAFKFNLFAPLDGNGLGHVILMIGVLFLYNGGIGLSVTA